MNEYYYSKNNQRFGPVSLEKLQELYNSGKIGNDSLVWKAGMADWQPIHTVLPNCPPPVRAAAPAGLVKPNNHLVMAIVVTLLCCLPCGVVGIIKAGSVDPLWNAGRYNEAIAASESAHKWNMIGLIVGLIANAMLFGLGMVGDLSQM